MRWWRINKRYQRRSRHKCCKRVHFGIKAFILNFSLLLFIWKLIFFNFYYFWQWKRVFIMRKLLLIAIKIIFIWSKQPIDFFWNLFYFFNYQIKRPFWMRSESFVEKNSFITSHMIKINYSKKDCDFMLRFLFFSSDFMRILA